MAKLVILSPAARYLKKLKEKPLKGDTRGRFCCVMKPF
jgi:hypothetical protein